MDIVKTYFLVEKGEYVLFGDVKQNIYNNKIENKDVSTNIRGVVELKRSFRSDYRIKDLIMSFQNKFFKDKYEIDKKEEFTGTLEIGYSTEKKGSIHYIYLSNTDNVKNMYNIIYQNIINKKIQPNDITVLGSSITLLKKFDVYYRYSCNEKTNTMFETNEIIYRYGINYTLTNQSKWINEFRILLKRENDRNLEIGNNQMSILLTLNDLCNEYGDIFINKLNDKCIKFNTKLDDFKKFMIKYEEEIRIFKSIFSEIKLKNNLNLVRNNKKINFNMNSGTIKISTIHSFKGWESETLFLIVENGFSLSFDEIIYTGITRSRKNLIIINFGNEKYNTDLREIVKNSIS